MALKMLDTSCSSKVRRDVFILNYMIDKVNEDQDIRRLCRYMTQRPFSKKAKNLNGEIVEQPDLKNPLTINSDEGKTVLWNGAFDNYQKKQERVEIFLHNNGTTYSEQKEAWNKDIWRFEVIVPQNYDYIIDDDSLPGYEFAIQRGYAIGVKLGDIFDLKNMDKKEYMTLTGDVKFILVGKSSTRLTKTSDTMIYTFLFQTESLDGRVQKTSGY